MAVFVAIADGYRTNATSSIDRAIRMSTAAAEARRAPSSGLTEDPAIAVGVPGVLS
jgi:hypothetical protein